jgi:hypothetical protein
VDSGQLVPYLLAGGDICKHHALVPGARRKQAAPRSETQARHRRSVTLQLRKRLHPRRRGEQVRLGRSAFAVALVRLCAFVCPWSLPWSTSQASCPQQQLLLEASAFFVDMRLKPNRAIPKKCFFAAAKILAK